MSLESPTVGETIEQGAALLCEREGQLGRVADDGPSAEDAIRLAAMVSELLSLTEDATPSQVWQVFDAVVKLEMKWIFPERDPIGVLMVPALQRMQTTLGESICEAVPSERERLDTYVSLEITANAAQRKETVDGNWPSWRMFMARAMNKIGARQMAISIANREIERWRNCGK